jgi:hypothetical protein
MSGMIPGTGKKTPGGERAGHSASSVLKAELVAAAVVLFISPLGFVLMIVMRVKLWKSDVEWSKPVKRGLLLFGVVFAFEVVLGLNPLVMLLTGGVVAVVGVLSGEPIAMLVGVFSVVAHGVPAALIGSGVWIKIEEIQSGGAEWHPAEIRRQRVLEVQRQNQALASMEKLKASVNLAMGPQTLCSESPLGVLHKAHETDLQEWTQNEFAVVPRSVRGRGMALVGASGAGKTETIIRMVSVAAEAGRKVFLIDCKGTDPELAGRVVAEYKRHNAEARVAYWPSQPFDMWRGTPGQVVDRLMGLSTYDHPYYSDATRTVLSTLLDGAYRAGTPVQNSRQFLNLLTPEAIQELWPSESVEHKMAAGMRLPGGKLTEDIHGAQLRTYQFFHTMAGRFDGDISFEDVDVAVFSAPALVSAAEAQGAVRVLLADWQHYVASRKPRVGEDVTLIIDEFSAVKNASSLAAGAAERVRDVGGQLIVTSQSWEGLGENDDERERLVGAMSGGLILHRVINPDRLCMFGGTARRVEKSWQMDGFGQTGMGTSKMAHAFRVLPDDVRKLGVGEAFVIANGRSLRVQVLPAEADELSVEKAVKLAREAQGVVYDWRNVQEAEWWVEPLKAPEPKALNPAPQRFALTWEPDNEPVTAETPPPIFSPPRRLELALAAAVREWDLESAKRIAVLTEQVTPGWNGRQALEQLCELRIQQRSAVRARRGARVRVGSGAKK